MTINPIVKLNWRFDGGNAKAMITEAIGNTSVNVRQSSGMLADGSVMVRLWFGNVWQMFADSGQHLLSLPAHSVDAQETNVKLVIEPPRAQALSLFHT